MSPQEEQTLLDELQNHFREEECARRGDRLLEWCGRMALHAFVPTKGAVLTEFGVRACKLLLLALLETPDTSAVSPPLVAWLQTHLVPCLFREEDGGTVAAHGDLLYPLIQILLRRLHPSSSSSS